MDLPGRVEEKSTKPHAEWVLALSQAGVALLEAHRSAVEACARSSQVSVAGEGFIFSDQADCSAPLRPDKVTRFFTEVRDEVGLRHVHLHSLRHFVATQLASRGEISVRTVAGRLGHADASVTMRTYAAFMPAADEDAAEHVGQVLGQPQPADGTEGRTPSRLTSELVQISCGPMAVTEVSYSAFLRGPGEVLPALERGDVQLDRRDGESLVMTRAARYRSWMQGMALSSRVMRQLLKEHPNLAEDLLADELPWLQWMPRHEQKDCVSELLTHLAAGAETGTFEPFARAIAEWEHTAEVWADPELAKRLRSDFPGDGEELERPISH